MSTFLTAEQVADELQVTARTIRGWLRDGDLVGIKIGKGWRVHKKDLERFLDYQRCEILLDRARKAHPQRNWVHGHCTECAMPIPIPEDSIEVWVCSRGCKSSYDESLATLLGKNSEEYVMSSSTVIPPY